MGSVSPESTQHVEQREFLMRSQGNTEYHSPNDGFTSSKSATSTIREKANSKTDAQLSEKSGWPLEPRKLRERDRFHWLSVLCDFLVTLLPVAFLVIGIAALHLDGKPRSQFGQDLIETSKYGTTAFPIVFAAVVARMNRAIALKWSERGAKLGTLEQLVGSQSLATTVERFFEIRKYDALSIALILTWLLSPFGSQMTLRLLSLRDSEQTGDAQVVYFNTTTDSETSFTGASYFASDKAAVSSLVGASLLSSSNVRKSPVDQWGNIKVPRIASIFDSSTQEGSDAWTDVGPPEQQDWASFSGLMTVGVPATDHTNFTAQTSYIEATCADSFQVPLVDGVDSVNETLHKANLNLMINNMSAPWNSYYGTGKTNTAFLDIVKTDEPDMSMTLPKNLIYGSIVGSGYFHGPMRLIEIFNCSTVLRQVELGVECRHGSCGVNRIRPSKEDLALLAPQPYRFMLGATPEIVGAPHPGSIGPIDQYMMGAANPFAAGDQPFKDGYSTVPGPELANRLTLLLNTVWQAGLCPYAIGLGSAANITACSIVPVVDDAQKSTAPATTITVKPRSMYVTNTWHAVVLVVISVFLQIAAIATTIIKTMTKAPKLFGYISSLTRENPHAMVPAGGTTMHGAARARYLSDTMVRIADTRPGEEVGHVSFCTVDGEQELAVGPLRKGRLYE